jgi:hypothetical protein
MSKVATMAQRNDSEYALAKGLGWFSIAVGGAEVLAPRALTRWLGMPGSETMLQAYGIREIGTGLGLLASNNPTGWIWGRLGGDALDIATLASGMANNNPKRGNVWVALAAVLGVTLVDAACAYALSQRRRASHIADPAMIEAYSRRSGFRAASPEAMRGAAHDFVIPEDMRTPKALRPWKSE